jgi:hypothetical protein
MLLHLTSSGAPLIPNVLENLRNKAFRRKARIIEQIKYPE